MFDCMVDVSKHSSCFFHFCFVFFGVLSFVSYLFVLFLAQTIFCIVLVFIMIVLFCNLY